MLNIRLCRLLVLVLRRAMRHLGSSAVNNPFSSFGIILAGFLAKSLFTNYINSLLNGFYATDNVEI